MLPRFLKFILFINIILACCLFSSPKTLPKTLDHLIMEGKNRLYDFHIKKARGLFQRAVNEFPDYPHGYFYLAYATLVQYSFNMMNDSLSKTLHQQIDIANEVAKRYHEKFPDDPDAGFHLGMIHGFEGVYHLLHRSYFKTYWSGRKAKKYLERVIRVDSTYYDAYMGLGLVHYYVGLLPGFLKIVASILGFKGDKELGKKEILLSANRGHFFRHESVLIYHGIRYFLEGEGVNSVAAFHSIHQKYPHNPGYILLLGYHYRKLGFIDLALKYFRAVPDSFVHDFPEITHIKYYNLGTSYFYLNDFHQAEFFFDSMIASKSRKSLYYQASINFYKGLLADLSFDRPRALHYYQNIFKNKQTEYWYYASQMFKKYPMDSLFYRYLVTRNLLYSRHFRESLSRAEKLRSEIKEGKKFVNPDLPILVFDLLGEIYYYRGNLKKSRKQFQNILPELKDMKDKFRRSWVYIHYVRCLRALKEYELAALMLTKAGDTDDDYTRIIIERERYVLNRYMSDGQKS